MKKSPGFEQCATGRAVIPVTGRQKSSLICVGEGQVRDKCPICTSFPTRTEKQRLSSKRSLHERIDASCTGAKPRS